MEIIRLHGGHKIKLRLPNPEMPIEEIPPPKKVILPLSDPSGLSCNPLVEKGKKVSKGEKIGEDPQNRMLSIHSPVSGEVTKLENYRLSGVGETLSIFIESDGKGTVKSDLSPIENFADADPLVLINTLKDAGVRILPFETLPEDERAITKIRPIKHFVINGIGHGFAGSVARRLIVTEIPRLLEGVRLIERLFRPEKAYLAVNRHHEDVLRAIEAGDLPNALEVIKLDVYYPLGRTLLLFKKIFGKEIPSPGGTAIDMGAVFCEVDTLLHALEAVKSGQPQTETYVSVSGEGVKTPKTLKVPIGTSLSDLIEHCGGFDGNPGRVALGNPFEGLAQFSVDAPVLKDSRWLWVQPEKRVYRERYRACINCGDCVGVCPVGLMPNFLGKFCEFLKPEEAASQYDLFTCIECGLCAYVCPSRRPLVQFMSHGKQELLLKEKEYGNG